MFDIWRKIDEKGAVAVPTKNSALSALGWVEIGEKYPELMPEEFRRYDVYSDRQLILESPFVVVSTEGTKSYHFKMTDPVGGRWLRALRENPGEFTLPGCDESLGEDEDALGAFTSSVEEMLDRRPYFRDMWEENA